MQANALSATAAVAGGTAVLYATLVGAAAGAVNVTGGGSDARERIALAEWAAIAIVMTAALGASLATNSAAPALVGGLACGGLWYWWQQILGPAK